MLIVDLSAVGTNFRVIYIEFRLARFERTMQTKLSARESQIVSKLQKHIEVQIFKQGLLLLLFDVIKTEIWQSVWHYSIQVSKFIKKKLKAFDDFKKKLKAYEIMFFDRWKNLRSENLFNTLYFEIKTNIKKISLRKDNQGTLFSFASSNASRFYF